MDNSPADIQHPVSDQDDWHNVTDAKKRKRIQDKLAQRARRKRLREAKKNTQETNQAASLRTSRATQTEDYCPSGFDVLAQLGCRDAIVLMPCVEDLTAPLMTCRNLPFQSSPTPQIPDMSYGLCPMPTVFSALYINGVVLGLTTCSVAPILSSPASPNIPPSLQPTPTQMLTIHQPAIDKFPFAKMRDNLINMCPIIDEEDFTRDLFTMPSFTITPGLASWDPKAWKIEKYFADKWGFLFY